MVRRPIIRMPPTISGTIRWKVHWVNAIERLITIRSAADGRESITRRARLPLSVLVLFFLAATGYGSCLTGLVPPLIGAAAELAAVLGVAISVTKTRPASAPTRGCWLLGNGMLIWLIGGMLSFVGHEPSVLTASQLIFGLLIPFAVYLGLRRLRLSERQWTWAFVAIAAGLILPLVSGTLAFRATFGSLSLDTIMKAYLDPIAWEDYGGATFGNRGNLAYLLVIVFPGLVWLAFSRRSPLWARGILATAAGLTALNLMITQSRTAILIAATSLPVMGMFRFRKQWKWVAGGLAASLLIAWMVIDLPDNAKNLVERTILAGSWNRDMDDSALERTIAMGKAWTLFKQNPLLGIGPGRALEENPFTSAHEFILNQASELGILGMVGSALWCLGILWQFGAAFASGLRRSHGEREFVLLLGPTCYVLAAIMANVPVTLTHNNSWMLITMGLAGLAASGSSLEVPAENRIRPEK